MTACSSRTRTWELASRCVSNLPNCAQRSANSEKLRCPFDHFYLASTHIFHFPKANITPQHKRLSKQFAWQQDNLLVGIFGLFQTSEFIQNSLKNVAKILDNFFHSNSISCVKQFRKKKLLRYVNSFLMKSLCSYQIHLSSFFFKFKLSSGFRAYKAVYKTRDWMYVLRNILSTALTT